MAARDIRSMLPNPEDDYVPPADPAATHAVAPDPSTPDPSATQHAGTKTGRVQAAVALSQNSEDRNEDASATAVRHYQNFATADMRRGQAVDSAADHEPDGYVPGEGKSRSVGRAAIAILVVAALAAVAVAIVTYGMELWGGKTVPRVVGMREPAAVERVESRGLTAKVETKPVDDGVGTVVEVLPSPGARVEPGSTVTLVVGARRMVPQVVGLSIEEARAALVTAGAEDFKIAFVPSDAPEGTVVAVDPAPDSSFTSRDTITLTVAASYTVPALVGKTEGDARHTLEMAGFLANVEYVESDEKSGTVVSCDPAEGERVESGSTVTLRVAQARPSDPRKLAEYFRYASRNIDAFLCDRDFAFVGATAGAASATCMYDGGSQGTVLFAPGPVMNHFVPDSSTNPLTAGKQIDGVRWTVGLQDMPGSVSRAAANGLAELCGLGVPLEVVYSDSVQRPNDVPSAEQDGLTWIAASGTDGSYTWLIIICSEGGSMGATVDYFGTDGLSDVSSYAARCGGSMTAALAMLDLYTS